MKKVVVIGGGFAGLSSASFLSDSNFKIELLETSPKLGGRAYSFIDNETATVIDNGQHILMGCYDETLSFLKLIGSEEKFSKQSHLSVNFIKQHFEVCPLLASGSFYPFNLLSALLNYSAISFYEKLLFIKFFAKIFLYSEKDLKKLTVLEWLLQEKQTSNLIKSFWELLAVSALNTDIKKASAFIFASVLKRIFFKGNDASTIILPAAGLSETYCDNALSFINKNEGNISLSESAVKLIIQDNVIKEIITSKRIITDFDFVISALPLHALKKILYKNNFLPDFDLDYSSILTVHLFLKKNRFENTFYGLIDSPVQWVFNKGSHLTVVISNADKFMDSSKEEIMEIIFTELKNNILLERDEVKTYRIIKEKRAAFVPSNNILDKRPSALTPFKNLFLAGDWTNTGLPATIESAVKSGRIAAGILLDV
jgi:squalene-associated FAD-dependent desaturase